MPRFWNHTQYWSADIILNKATWFFIFAQKFFIQGAHCYNYLRLLIQTLNWNFSTITHHFQKYLDLVNDWSAKTASDILTFIPYEWAMNISLRDFEMIWMANDYNWIDCSSNWLENSELIYFSL